MPYVLYYEVVWIETIRQNFLVNISNVKYYNLILDSKSMISAL